MYGVAPLFEQAQGLVVHTKVIKNAGNIQENDGEVKKSREADVRTPPSPRF